MSETAEASLLVTIHADLKGIVIPALKRVLIQGERILTALTDLEAAVMELSNDVDAVVTSIQQQQAAGSVSDAAAEAVVTSLQGLHTKLQALLPPPAPGA